MLTTFKTTGTATYAMEAISADHAEAIGVPEASHRIITCGGPVYGFLMAQGARPGAEVKVPGWTSARKGIRAVFVADFNGDGLTALDGYAA